MKLLIITQKVDENDDNLGFFHDWIKEFAKHCEKLTVIALGAGEYHLPENVKVLSLGKENSEIRNQKSEIIKKIKYLLKFYGYIWHYRRNYDNVFVHMNPEYVVLGGLLWKFWGKKTALWYTHKAVNLKLIIAEKLTDIIFTASSKSFRLPSGKVKIMGHGINTERFVPGSKAADGNIILSVDRISKTKRQLEIIKLFADIKKVIPDACLHIIGAPIRADDQSYWDELQAYVKNNNLAEGVKFFGAVANKNLPNFYQQTKVFINLSATGSLDKTVLEAMACNVPAVTTNEAFKDIVPKKNYSVNLEEAKQRVVEFLQSGDATDYRQIILSQHSLKNLIAKIIANT